jgi:hypothetical protein
MNTPFIVLCYVCQQEANDAAWEAHLADRPMSWLQGVALS